MSTTRVMDFKIRLKDEDGNYYLFRPYFRANLDDVGNVMNYTIVGSEEEGSLNELQQERLREMCDQIAQYLGKLIRNRQNDFTCFVNDFPSERQVENLLTGRTRKSGMIFPLTGINLEQAPKTVARVSAGKPSKNQRRRKPMTKLEKLKKIQEAYYALIPGLKAIALQDYALVMCDTPAYLKELIAEEEKRSDGSDKSGNEGE